ncbi:hypothetical protein FHX82_001162 [Amycolatopsis bartoniae]|uniref:Uncharacterized protein n=1 Tax=Amycolatopsis bartoniae TaxID=941986 RepID=A0A8H9MGV0_9PSEU|nr:hypothetical protein [Amycolatopsis bartoniae]MBB2934142.1 hypothetical protein [Amycolatopsis bartoniae]GHF84066.1 hypothetical protein GCM10017566_67580 [Amycolatopsis bartoniae]
MTARVTPHPPVTPAQPTARQRGNAMDTPQPVPEPVLYRVEEAMRLLSMS